MGKIIFVILINTECARIPYLVVFKRCILSNNANLFVTFGIDMQWFFRCFSTSTHLPGVAAWEICLSISNKLMSVKG